MPDHDLTIDKAIHILTMCQFGTNRPSDDMGDAILLALRELKNANNRIERLEDHIESLQCQINRLCRAPE